MARDARELIRTYRESEWRTTRLEVIRQLGEFQDARSFHFLSNIIQKEEDLAEQQRAIFALAQRKSFSSKLFFRHFYRIAPDTLKPSLAHALGSVQDLASISLLLSDWDLAVSKKDWAWVRNILLSLGELKAFDGLPKIISFFQDQRIHPSAEILFAGLFSLGRLSRHPHELQEAIRHHQVRIDEDALLFQVYQSALSQVQVRSQFKLEDYLNKIFTLPDPHPILPMELLSFDPDEVDLGLSLFSVEKDWKRLLFALKGVQPSRRKPHLLAIARSLQAVGNFENYFHWFDSLRELGEESSTLVEISKIVQPERLTQEMRLKWLEIDGSFEKEAESFLKSSSDELAIRWINGWNEYWNGRILATDRPELEKKIKSWIQSGLNPLVYARLIRACAELELEIDLIHLNFETDFDNEGIRSSLLLYLEKNPLKVQPVVLARSISALKDEELEKLGLRLLSTLEIYALSKRWIQEFDEYLRVFENHFNVDFRVGVIRIRGITKHDEPYLLKQLEQEQEVLVLNAIIALKSFSDSSVAAEALSPFLNSNSEVIRGRALDALCENISLKAKQFVMKHLEEFLNTEEVVDKIYRCFDPQKKGGEAFVKQLELLLTKNPEHEQWEKLVQLRDRLRGSVPVRLESTALKELDLKLAEVIPLFSKLDPAIQSALRAAEQPFHQSLDLQNLPVDKAPTVLEYCKALDLIFERHLGQKYLFPKLDQKLHDFQKLWHQLGFSEDYPSPEQVLNALGLKGKIASEHFPLHKSKLMCATFFNGKILQDRFKIFDGLRSWAVILLFFTRKIPTIPGTPVLVIPSKMDANTWNEKCISIAKRLMTLQDLRNPAAHRQTYTELQYVTTVRNEAIELVNTVLALVL
jgi:HEAT repeat protein